MAEFSPEGVWHHSQRGGWTLWALPDPWPVFSFTETQAIVTIKMRLLELTDEWHDVACTAPWIDRGRVTVTPPGIEDLLKPRPRFIDEQREYLRRLKRLLFEGSETHPVLADDVIFADRMGFNRGVHAAAHVYIAGAEPITDSHSPLDEIAPED